MADGVSRDEEAIPSRAALGRLAVKVLIARRPRPLGTGEVYCGRAGNIDKGELSEINGARTRR